MNRLRHLRWWYALGLLGLAAVTVLSLLPLPEDLPSPPGEDLTLHLLAWGVLSTWFAQFSPPRSRWRVALLLWLWSLAIEGAQAATGYRSAEWMDALANGLGVLLGQAAGHMLGDRLLRRLEAVLLRGAGS